MTFDMEGPFSASQKASWRTCTGKRPAISAGVHYLPVSLSCATQRVRPGRLTTSESVQLRARRAILQDQIAVSKFSNFEYRMAELEEEVRVRNGNAARPG